MTSRSKEHHTSPEIYIRTNFTHHCPQLTGAGPEFRLSAAAAAVAVGEGCTVGAGAVAVEVNATAEHFGVAAALVVARAMVARAAVLAAAEAAEAAEAVIMVVVEASGPAAGAQSAGPETSGFAQAVEPPVGATAGAAASSGRSQ